MPRSEKVLSRTFLSYIGGGQDDVICAQKTERDPIHIIISQK